MGCTELAIIGFDKTIDFSDAFSGAINMHVNWNAVFTNAENKLKKVGWIGVGVDRLQGQIGFTKGV